MPEQPEIHWLWYYGFALALTLLVGIVGTYLVLRKDKANEERRRKAEKFTPTHRRTRER